MKLKLQLNSWIAFCIHTNFFQLNMNTKEELSFDMPTNHFPGEPVFVPRNNPPSPDDDEDDGVVLAGGYSSENKKGKPLLKY